MTGVDIHAHAYALLDSAEKLRSVREVADVRLLSFDRPPKWYFDAGGQWERMGLRIDILSYARFQVRWLVNAVRTDYVLNIQSDGWITSAAMWDDGFLDYDYIGAPWKPDRTKGLRVGNSGFCLRSRRFMELCAIKWDAVASTQSPHLFRPYEDQGDDVYWSQVIQNWLMANGIRFAPLEVAARFSIEQTIPEYPNRTPEDCLGQHARYRHSSADDPPRTT